MQAHLTEYGPLTEAADVLRYTFERMQYEEREIDKMMSAFEDEPEPGKVNLMECIEHSGLGYTRGRAAANELVRQGVIRIEGDLG